MTKISQRRAGPSASSPVPTIFVPVKEPVDRDSIYLDYAATTPVDPVVASAMSGFLTVNGIFGNPASKTHGAGRAAAEVVESVRQEIASFLSSKPEEIIWTSGATESINLALKGAALARRDRGDHIVVSTLEHKAVLDSAAWLESQGFEISYVVPDKTGRITIKNVLDVLRPDTIVVSLMYVNNETGAVTDFASIGPKLRQQGVLLHVDAVQGAARMPLDDVAAEADLISISAHKMYGPKGIGVLRIRTPLSRELTSQIHGGGHEFGLRSGTLPTHQIVGMGEAARLVRKRRKVDTKHVAALDTRLRTHFARIKGATLNGTAEQRVPGILNVYFPGVEVESLILALGNIAISSGSACTSSDIEPSHVLLALGYGTERALSSARFSFGRFTTMDEIDHAGRLVQDTVAALRRISQ